MVKAVNILKHHDMDIVGQGGKIILFTLPALGAAILAQRYAPGAVALPEGVRFLRPAGYPLLLVGLAFWATAVVQLLIGFPQGKLITSGAYGIVRNPIYSSATFFLLPAVALLTWTWPYLIASLALYGGVMLFIGVEEQQLTRVFGQKYRDYTARVHRLVPFKRPTSPGI